MYYNLIVAQLQDDHVIESDLENGSRSRLFVSETICVDANGSTKGLNDLQTNCCAITIQSANESDFENGTHTRLVASGTICVDANGSTKGLNE